MIDDVVSIHMLDDGDDEQQKKNCAEEASRG